jgi:hypothetical protein
MWNILIILWPLFFVKKLKTKIVKLIILYIVLKDIRNIEN